MIRAAVIALALATPASADRVLLGRRDAFVVYDGKHATRPFKSPRVITHIAPAGPGELWLGSLLTVQRWDGRKLEDKALEIALHLRVSAAGVLWLGNEKEVSWFDGTWHALPLPREGGELLKDLEIDDRGRVWIILGKRLLYTQGRGWTTFVPPDGDVQFCKLAVRGDLYLACWEDLHRLSNTTWTKIAPLDKLAIDDLHVAADGTIYVVAGGKMHVRNGDRTVDFTLPRWTLNGFVVDGTGRMWFASDRGLAVFDAKGKQLKLPRALATKDAVTAVYVEGVGPTF